MWISRRLGSDGERLATQECPVSLVTPDTWAWIEEYWTRRSLGASALTLDAPARTVDAFVVLESEARVWEQENDG